MCTGILIELCLLVMPFSAAACTGVVIVREGEVLLGGNEDWERFDVHIWAPVPNSFQRGVRGARSRTS